MPKFIFYYTKEITAPTESKAFKQLSKTKAKLYSVQVKEEEPQTPQDFSPAIGFHYEAEEE